VKFVGNYGLSETDMERLKTEVSKIRNIDMHHLHWIGFWFGDPKHKGTYRLCCTDTSAGHGYDMATRYDKIQKE